MRPPGPHTPTVTHVTAAQLFRFICKSAELVGEELICRASLWEELGRRGVSVGPERKRLRSRLVKELESQGLIRRPHPRSRYLLILKPPADLRRRLHMGFDARKLILELSLLVALSGIIGPIPSRPLDPFRRGGPRQVEHVGKGGRLQGFDQEGIS